MWVIVSQFFSNRTSAQLWVFTHVTLLVFTLHFLHSVLVRVDFNVPMTKDGKVADANRILQTIPTLQYILEKGSDGCGTEVEIIVCSKFYIFFLLLFT